MWFPQIKTDPPTILAMGLIVVGDALAWGSSWQYGLAYTIALLILIAGSTKITFNE